MSNKVAATMERGSYDEENLKFENFSNFLNLLDFQLLSENVLFRVLENF